MRNHSIHSLAIIICVRFHGSEYEGAKTEKGMKYNQRKGENMIDWLTHERELFLVLPNGYCRPPSPTWDKTVQIIRSHKITPLDAQRRLCVQRHVYKSSETLRSLEVMVCFAFFSFLAFRFWIAPLYSVFPVVTLTQTNRKWRGDGEDEDMRPVVGTLGVYSVCSVVPCELKHKYKAVRHVFFFRKEQQDEKKDFQ